MIVNLGAPYRKFTANFKYLVKPTVSDHKYKGLKTDDYSKFDSICNETMVGFVQNTKTGKWQCARAKQTKASNTQIPTMVTKNAAFITKRRKGKRGAITHSLS